MKLSGNWIPIEVNDLTLSNTDKMVLSIIKSLDKGEGCFPSNKYLGDKVHCKIRNITKVLAKLSSKRFINITIKNYNERCITYLIGDSTRVLGDSTRVLGGVALECQGDSTGVPPYNKIYNNIYKEKNFIKKESKKIILIPLDEETIESIISQIKHSDKDFYKLHKLLIRRLNKMLHLFDLSIFNHNEKEAYIKKLIQSLYYNYAHMRVDHKKIDFWTSELISIDDWNKYMFYALISSIQYFIDHPPPSRDQRYDHRLPSLKEIKDKYKALKPKVICQFHDAYQQESVEEKKRVIFDKRWDTIIEECDKLKLITCDEFLRGVWKQLYYKTKLEDSEPCLYHILNFLKNNTEISVNYIFNYYFEVQPEERNNINKDLHSLSSCPQSELPKDENGNIIEIYNNEGAMNFFVNLYCCQIVESLYKHDKVFAYSSKTEAFEEIPDVGN